MTEKYFDITNYGSKVIKIFTSSELSMLGPIGVFPPSAEILPRETMQFRAALINDCTGKTSSEIKMKYYFPGSEGSPVILGCLEFCPKDILL